ncbi:MAG: hypothetical protein V4676_11910, partial [Bacteroidota bacterium]
MLDKIFSWSKKKPEDEAAPGIIFGRYSDNNKSVSKVDQWNKADALFKEKKYHQSIAIFFNYLCDDTMNNVTHHQENGKGTFQFIQGSKIVRGFYDDKKFEAEAVLAEMPDASVPVMRRLLEMNFTLYYTRYALSNKKLSMLFDSDIQTANPSKLYYGLKELATKTDKHDDLLVQDFTSLLPTDTEHLQEIPDEEKAIKFRYFKKWIKTTLELIAGIDTDKYSGGIAYLLLALTYR